MTPMLPFTEETIVRAAETLRRGGVVIVPTETVYGVVCHPDFPEALERIRKMKGRDRDKPFQLLAADAAAVWADGAARSPAAERAAERVVEGATRRPFKTKKRAGKDPARRRFCFIGRSGVCGR